MNNYNNKFDYFFYVLFLIIILHFLPKSVIVFCIVVNELLNPTLLIKQNETDT